MLRVDSLKKIEEPWFKTIDEDKFLDGIYQAEQWTEDLYFFEKLSKIDGHVYCDASVICEHFNVYENKIYRLPKESLPMRQKLTNGHKKVLILGPLINFNETYDVTRCTNDNNDPEADYRCSFDNLPFDENQFDWVIITEPQTINAFNVDVWKEWKRVSKDRLSVNIHPFINQAEIAKLFCGKSDGSFVEVRENVNTQDELQSDKPSDNNYTGIISEQRAEIVAGN